MVQNTAFVLKNRQIIRREKLEIGANCLLLGLYFRYKGVTSNVRFVKDFLSL